MLIKCLRDNHIFEAEPQPRYTPDFKADELVLKPAIDCPMCGRRYVQCNDGTFYSDRTLHIIRK